MRYVDLGLITVDDGLALQRALRVAVESGELWSNESYRAIVEFRKELAVKLVTADASR